MWKKIVLGVLGLIVLLVIVAVVWLSPRFIIGILTYGQQVREGTLVVGDPAPVVSLIELAGLQSRELGEWFGEKPVVLVFGSFT